MHYADADKNGRRPPGRGKAIDSRGDLYVTHGITEQSFRKIDGDTLQVVREHLRRHHAQVFQGQL